MGAVIRRETAADARTFSFEDLDRRARAILAAAEERARALTADAERRAQALTERSRQEGYAAGLAEGRTAGRQQAYAEARAAATQAVQADVTQAVAALQAARDAFERERRNLLAQAEAGLIRLALAVATRVCKRLLADPGPVARANARALLDAVARDHAVELHVHPDDLAHLTDLAEAVGRPSEFVALLPDPDVPRGGCVLRTGDSTAVATVAEQLDRIAAALCVDAAREDAP